MSNVGKDIPAESAAGSSNQQVLVCNQFLSTFFSFFLLWLLMAHAGAACCIGHTSLHVSVHAWAAHAHVQLDP